MEKGSKVKKGCLVPLLIVMAIVGFVLIETALLLALPEPSDMAERQEATIGASEELEKLGALALGVAMVGAVLILPVFLFLLALPR